MEKHIAVIPGDGIGPEIVKEAVKVLDVIAKKYGHRFVYTEVDAEAAPLINTEPHCQGKPGCGACQRQRAAGAVGGPKWDHVDPSIRPEKALFKHSQGAWSVCQSASLQKFL